MVAACFHHIRLIFHRLRNSEENILPKVSGLKRVRWAAWNQARYGIGWGALGAAMACYDTALQYAKTRKQFANKPIAAHQLVQEKLAWMITEIVKGQLLALHVERLEDNRKVDPSHISMLKMNNVGIALETARKARDILGANGIVDDYCIMRHMNNLESVYTYEEHRTTFTELVIGERITGISRPFVARTRHPHGSTPSRRQPKNSCILEGAGSPSEPIPSAPARLLMSRSTQLQVPNTRRRTAARRSFPRMLRAQTPPAARTTRAPQSAQSQPAEPEKFKKSVPSPFSEYRSCRLSGAIADAYKSLRFAQTIFESRGYVVQNLQIATQTISGIPATSPRRKRSNFSSSSTPSRPKTKFKSAIGPAMYHGADTTAQAELHRILLGHETFSAAVQSLRQNGLHANAAGAAARIIKKLSRHAETVRVRCASPRSPWSRHSHPVRPPRMSMASDTRFPIALQSANLVTSAANGAHRRGNRTSVASPTHLAPTLRGGNARRARGRRTGLGLHRHGLIAATLKGRLHRRRPRKSFRPPGRLARKRSLTARTISSAIHGIGFKQVGFSVAASYSRRPHTRATLERRPHHYRYSARLSFLGQHGARRRTITERCLPAVNSNSSS